MGKLYHLDVEFIYHRLIRMFFTNAIIDNDILAITSLVNGKMIINNKQYLSEWLNLSLSASRVFSINKLLAIVPSLLKEV